MTKEELENYEPKGQLEGFPKEVIARMLDCQEEQGNKRDVTVFEETRASYFEGLKWYQTEEGYDYTFYDQEYQELDGGVYDNLDVSLTEAAEDMSAGADKSYQGSSDSTQGS